MLRRRLMLRLRLGLGSGSGLGSGLGLSEPVPLQQVVRWPSQTPRPAGSGCRLVRGGSSVGWKLVHRVACCAPRKAVGHMAVALHFTFRSALLLRSPQEGVVIDFRQKPGFARSLYAFLLSCSLTGGLAAPELHGTSTSSLSNNQNNHQNKLVQYKTPVPTAHTLAPATLNCTNSAASIAHRLVCFPCARITAFRF